VAAVAVLACVSAWGGAGVARAAIAAPSWAGDPGSTGQEFLFTSTADPAPANVDDNPFGSPTADISFGAGASGWQDPADGIFALSGANSDGAWDVGVGGGVGTTIAIAAAPPGPGTFYQVEFVVTVVAYDDLPVLPEFSVPGGTVLGLAMSEQVIANDPIIPGATWTARTWTGTVDGVNGDTVEFVAAAPPGGLSVIDDFEVFTRFVVVPEPTSALLVLVGGALGLCRRRR